MTKKINISIKKFCHLCKDTHSDNHCKDCVIATRFYKDCTNAIELVWDSNTLDGSQTELLP